MSLVIKTNKVHFRDANNSNYIGINAVAEKTTDDLVASVQTKATSIIQQANSKLSETEDLLNDIIDDADDAVTQATSVKNAAVDGVNSAQTQLNSITTAAADTLNTTSSYLDTKKTDTISYVNTTLDQKRQDIIEDVNERFTDSIAQMDAYKDEVADSISALTASVAAAVEGGVDDTLTLQGVPADAKATGIFINNITDILSNNLLQLGFSVVDGALCVTYTEEDT